MLKNKIFIILLMLSFILPVNALPEDVQVDTLNEPAQELLTPNEGEVNEVAETPDMSKSLKQPISKRRVAKKFLLAMFGVCASSFIIYFSLTLYNKLRDRFDSSNMLLNQRESTMLDTPETHQDAVKIFVEKTNWQ